MMWDWKLLKDREHIISPQNALFFINWFYYSWISKIVKWFGVWNSAHISCKCSVHGVISANYYQGHNASNSFLLQTNNVPFLWIVYFKLPFIPCATFIWKNVDDIWGFFLSGADVHDERQDLQLLCLLPAYQQDRCGPEKKVHYLTMTMLTIFIII